MARGKSLKLFLMDGDPTGRWVCTLAGRTTKAYRIPRKYYKNSSDIQELRKPAVYMLMGEDDVTHQPVAYIGEAEDVYDRLKDHIDKKDFWNEVVAFVSQDDHFNKAHVKYLESRLYAIAAEVDRCKILNTQVPKAPSISIDEQDEMEDFIDNVKVISYAMGYKLFEALDKKDVDAIASATDDEYFYIEGKNISAKMYRSAEGYVLCKGTKINTSTNKSTPTWALKKREELIAEGSLVGNEITRNVVFSSPSGASDLVTGNSTSGRKKWKNKQDITLGEILDSEK